MWTNPSSCTQMPVNMPLVPFCVKVQSTLLFPLNMPADCFFRLSAITAPPIERPLQLCGHWRSFVAVWECNQVLIMTDHQALRWLMNLKSPTVNWLGGHCRFKDTMPPSNTSPIVNQKIYRIEFQQWKMLKCLHFIIITRNEQMLPLFFPIVCVYLLPTSSQSHCLEMNSVISNLSLIFVSLFREV